MRKLVIVVTIILSFIGNKGLAQCEITDNKYFKPGENLTYDLYFKYGIMASKAGYASLFTQKTQYGSQSAYKMSLVSHSTGAARRFFKLDDTLVAFMDVKLKPLAFWKDAHEGDDNVVERQTYSYQPDGSIHIRARRLKNGEERHNVLLTTQSCTYDMISIIYYARTLDYDNMQRNSKTNVVFISGKKKVNMQIHYEGLERVQANNNRTYTCYKLALTILDDAFVNQENAMRVYITNDLNRIPVQIESRLKIGSSRAVLRSFAGLKNPVGAK